jgi:hypothetical protein
MMNQALINLYVMLGKFPPETMGPQGDKKTEEDAAASQ